MPGRTSILVRGVLSLTVMISITPESISLNRNLVDLSLQNKLRM